MRTKLSIVRHHYVFLTLVVGLLAMAASGLVARPAYAQPNTMMPDRGYTAGPFMLHDGERVLIGLLLPAVQKAREAANFSLLDSSGMRIFTRDLQPPSPNAPLFSSFFDITYRMASANDPNGGVIEIRGKGTPGGGDIVEIPSEDGILIGLLLPAVQHNGKTAFPMATSMQSFNAEGGTMTHSFFDVFAKPGPGQLPKAHHVIEARPQSVSTRIGISIARA